MAEARIWATTTDLEGTNYERKRYFIAVEDGGKRIDVELVVGPEKAISVEPFVPHEFDYTVHDGCDHEENYCVLEDEESGEYEELWLSESYYRDVKKQKQEQPS